MEIALVEGRRHQPEPGLKGLCQFCGREMMAKCGELLVWHWAHKGRKQCDPWWENEGPWHRGWKDLFPREWHEQVRFDTAGEKHIADVLLPTGMVVELQHSPMPLEEMRSREAFYKQMIWVVDAAPFLQHLTILDPLPDPSLPEVADFRFFAPHPARRHQSRQVRKSYDNLMYYRASSKQPGDTLVEMLSGRDIGLHFATTYVGHHLLLWIKPREVWLSTTHPTYLDLGDGLLGQLMYYPPAHHGVLCVQLVQKTTLVQRLIS
jgi:hypothetical protein